MNKDLKDIVMVFCGSPDVPCLDERIFEELDAKLDYAIQFYKNPGRFLDGIPPAVHWMVNPLPFYLPIREPYVRWMYRLTMEEYNAMFADRYNTEDYPAAGWPPIRGSEAKLAPQASVSRSP